MTTDSWQHTKIICTLGPATDRPGVLEGLIRGGMDVARINLSHGTHEDHTRRIRGVRALSRDLARPVSILADLPGPKFRLGELPGGSLKLEDGARVYLAEAADAPDCLPLGERALLDALQAGQSVYLADGAVELLVKAAAAGRVECEVRAGGTVRSGSGVNIPELGLPAVIPTERDRLGLAFAASQAVDWIGVSFVQDADDLARVRAALAGAYQPLLMAKIEKRRALESLDAIVESADAIMVARGDLGVETNLAQIPLVQKRIIAAANARARPVVTATQMLESMVEHERPTRAEVTDIANAVLDGTDAVMLSAESAIGRHPVATVNMLRRVVAATNAEYAASMAQGRLRASGAVGADEAIGFAACQLAEQIDARAIVVHVQSLPQAAAIARFRPRAPIVALADSAGLHRSLTLVSGVSPLYVPTPADAQTRIARAQDWLYAHTPARPGERVVVLSALAGAEETVDTLQIVRLSD
ncbi:MAG TPA: pyruvate kinase [Arenicellales bacterium]|nr:pyruvate kinase [Arenicellales bacterium]